MVVERDRFDPTPFPSRVWNAAEREPRRKKGVWIALGAIAGRWPTRVVPVIVLVDVHVHVNVHVHEHEAEHVTGETTAP